MRGLAALEVCLAMVLFTNCVTTPPAVLTDLQAQQAQTSEVIGEATVAASSLVSDLEKLDIPEPIKEKAKAVEKLTAEVKASHDVEIKQTVVAAGEYTKVVADMAKQKQKASKWFAIAVVLAVALAALAAIEIRRLIGH